MRERFDISTFVAFLGFGLYWAWVTVTFYSNSVFAFSDASASKIESFWLYATIAHGSTLIICACLASKIGSLVRHRLSIPVVAIMHCFGMAVLVLYGINGGLGAPLIFIAAFVGVFSSLHFLMWVELYACLSITQMTIYSLFSFFAGLTLYFVFTHFLIPVVGTFAAVVLPALSALCLFCCRNLSGPFTGDAIAAAKTLNSEESAHFFDTGILVVALFVFALSGEILRMFSVALAGADTNTMGALYLFGGFMGLAGLLAYCLIPVKGRAVRFITMRVVRTILVLMALAFLAIPLVSNYSLALGYGMFGAGFWCFRAVSWIYCFLFIRRFNTNPLRVGGVLDGAFAISVVASTPLNTFLASHLSESATALLLVVLLIALILMFIVVFVLYNRQSTTVFNVYEKELNALPESRDSAGAVTSLESLYSERVQVLAQQYGLTERETEVVQLMAQGRSLPFIQEALFISAGTAQTHSRHIYKKLGIHTRQELIDLVGRSE